MVRTAKFIVMSRDFRKGEILRRTAAVKMDGVHKLLH
jgi:hypothetical protein